MIIYKWSLSLSVSTVSVNLLTLWSLIAITSTMACILARLSLDYIHHLQTNTTVLTSPLQLDGSLSASSCTILLQSIRELLTTSGPTVFISINEVNLQYHSTSSLADEYTPETLLLRALDSDTTNQNKLRVPFVATVAMMPHSVSPIAYQELRQ